MSRTTNLIDAIAYRTYDTGAWLHSIAVARIDASKHAKGWDGIYPVKRRMAAPVLWLVAISKAVMRWGAALNCAAHGHDWIVREPGPWDDPDHPEVGWMYNEDAAGLLLVPMCSCCGTTEGAPDIEGFTVAEIMVRGIRIEK